MMKYFISLLILTSFYNAFAVDDLVKVKPIHDDKKICPKIKVSDFILSQSANPESSRPESFLIEVVGREEASNFTLDKCQQFWDSSNCEYKSEIPHESIKSLVRDSFCTSDKEGYYRCLRVSFHSVKRICTYKLY